MSLPDTAIPFGRKLVTGRLLQCRCDASTLLLPLPTPHNDSFCHLCGYRAEKA